jgi:Glycosyltransferase family 92
MSNIAFLTVCRNDAWRIEEYVRYHSALGVDHFVFYDDQSTDNTQEVLSRLSKDFCISVFKTDGRGRYSQHDPNIYERNGDVQDRIVRHTKAGLEYLRDSVKDIEWCGVFELDEFLTPVDPLNCLKPYFKEYISDKADLKRIYVHSFDMMGPFTPDSAVSKSSDKCWSQATKNGELGGKFSTRGKSFINMRKWGGVCTFIHYIDHSPFLNEGEEVGENDGWMKGRAPKSLWSTMLGAQNNLRICHFRNASPIQTYDDFFPNTAFVL